jgi:hypothetical protein
MLLVSRKDALNPGHSGSAVPLVRFRLLTMEASTAVDIGAAELRSTPSTQNVSKDGMSLPQIQAVTSL